MKKIVNLTPHEIVVVRAGAESLRFAPSGTVARVATVVASQPVLATELGEIPVVSSRAGAVTGLPAPVEGVAFLVSAQVRLAPECAGRLDVLSPGDLVRDAKGVVTGCAGLIQNEVMT